MTDNCVPKVIFFWLSQGQKLNYAHLKLAVLFKMMMTMTTATTSKNHLKNMEVDTPNHVSIR